MDNRAIGVFDSGVGGLTVAKALSKLLPNENLVYFGDTAHLPYGDKSPEAIQNYSLGIAKYLIEAHQVKAILIACNSASAVAFNALQDRFSAVVPIFNVIDPVARYIGLESNFSKVGVIGTRATVTSKTYTNKIKELNPKVEVASLPTPLLVPIIEEGLSNTSISSETLRHYLSDGVLKSVEALVLGCTHYPHIQDEIEQLKRNSIALIHSPEIVSKKLKEVLGALSLLNSGSELGTYSFYVSDYTVVFEQIAQLMFGKNIHLQEQNIWK